MLIVLPDLQALPTLSKADRRPVSADSSPETDIVPITGYGTIPRPESHNTVSILRRTETYQRSSCVKSYHPANLPLHLHSSQTHRNLECLKCHWATPPLTVASSSSMENQYPVTSSSSLRIIPTWTSTRPNASSSRRWKTNSESDKARSSAHPNNQSRREKQIPSAALLYPVARIRYFANCQLSNLILRIFRLCIIRLRQICYSLYANSTLKIKI